MGEAPVEMSVTISKVSARGGNKNVSLQYIRLQVPQLVLPLCSNPQRILVESHDNQEATNARHVGFQWLGVNFDCSLDLFANRADLFERVIGVRRPVSSGGLRIGESMGVSVVAGRHWASDVDARGHLVSW